MEKIVIDPSQEVCVTCNGGLVPFNKNGQRIKPKKYLSSIKSSPGRIITQNQQKDISVPFLINAYKDDNVSIISDGNGSFYETVVGTDNGKTRKVLSVNNDGSRSVKVLSVRSNPFKTESVITNQSSLNSEKKRINNLANLVLLENMQNLNKKQETPTVLSKSVGSSPSFVNKFRARLNALKNEIPRDYGTPSLNELRDKYLILKQTPTLRDDDIRSISSFRREIEQEKRNVDFPKYEIVDDYASIPTLRKRLEIEKRRNTPENSDNIIFIPNENVTLPKIKTHLNDMKHNISQKIETIYRNPDDDGIIEETILVEEHMPDILPKVPNTPIILKKKLLPTKKYIDLKPSFPEKRFIDPAGGIYPNIRTSYNKIYLTKKRYDDNIFENIPRPYKSDSHSVYF